MTTILKVKCDFFVVFFFRPGLFAALHWTSDLKKKKKKKRKEKPLVVITAGQAPGCQLIINTMHTLWLAPAWAACEQTVPEALTHFGLAVCTKAALNYRTEQVQRPVRFFCWAGGRTDARADCAAFLATANKT